MQKAANKLKIVLILFLVGLWCYSCGTGDFLDETNLRYQIDVEFADGGDEATLSADIHWNDDCNGDGNTTDPEDFTDLIANIEITVDENAPGLTMTGYRVSFEPLTTVDTSGNIIQPPDMPTPYTGSYDVDIPSNSIVSFWITCMEIDMKLYMETFMPACTIVGCPDYIYRYQITIRMDFIDEYLESRDFTIRRTIYFGRYNKC
jgi:hypothetical protein